MMKIGLEKEFFLLKDGKPQVLTDPLNILPKDECGWLVEARGNPFGNITEAVFSLKANIFEIESKLKTIRFPEKISKNDDGEIAIQGQPKLVLDDTPFMTIDRAMRVSASRHFAKPMTKYQNFYGFQHHATKHLEATAGVHISFTNQLTYCEEKTTRTVNLNFDWPRIFLGLDKAFSEEIKVSKRKPGFYELKSDGRVEYRSLPSNVDLEKLISVVKELIADPL